MKYFWRHRSFSGGSGCCIGVATLLLACLLIVGICLRPGVCLADEQAEDSKKSVQDKGNDKKSEDTNKKSAGSDASDNKDEEKKGVTKGTRLTPAEEKLFALFAAYAKANEADANSVEAKRISEEIDATLSRIEAEYETAPDADLSKLPGGNGNGGDSKDGGDQKGMIPSARIRPAAKPGSNSDNGVNGKKAVAEKDAEDTGTDAKEAVTKEGEDKAKGGEDKPKEGDDLDSGALEVTKEVVEVVEVVAPAVPLEPNDVVTLNIKDNLLDIDLLIEMIGKEMKFTFLDTPPGVSGTVELRQFGEIRYRDLLPLLESVLSFKGFVMVREDPFIRIVQRDQATKKTKLPVTYGQELPELEVGDSVVTQIVEIKHANLPDVTGLLGRFTDQTVQPIASTNYLIITDYGWRMPRLMEMIDLLDQPGPERVLEILKVEYVEAGKVSGKIVELVKDLAGEQAKGARGSVAPPPRPPKERSRKKKEGPAVPSVSRVGSSGPIIHVDERTNRLLVIGTHDEIAQVRELLALLDIEGYRGEIRLEVFQIKHVVVDDLVSQVSELVQALSQEDYDPDGDRGRDTRKRDDQQPSRSRSRRPSRDSSRMSRGGGMSMSRAGDDGPLLLADDRTNRLLVVGSDDQLALVKEMLALLDLPPYEYDVVEIKIYVPLYVEVAEALDILEKLEIIRKTGRVSPRERARGNRPDDQPRRPLGPTREGETPLLPGEEEFEVKVAIQESVNKMFVLATVGQHEQIAEIMGHIDVEPDESLGGTQIYDLEHRTPEDVTDMLTRLLDAAKEDEQSDKNVQLPGREKEIRVESLDKIFAIGVHGTTKQHEEVKRLLKILDRPKPQVLVEAILVQVSATDALKLGITLKDAQSVGGDRMLSGVSPFGIGDIAQSGNIVTGSGGVLAFFDSEMLYATLEAMQTQVNARVMSKPRILVDHDEEGTIDSKRGEPTTKTTVAAGSDTPIIEFAGYEDAGTKLTIKPLVSEGNFLQLTIDLSVENFEGEGTENVPPAKVSNSVSTVVAVPDGKAIVLGGLTTTNEGTTVNKIPLLGDLPFIGALFRNVVRGNDEAVLYVFVRATIVRSREEFEALSKKHEDKVRGLEEEGQKPLVPGLPPERSKRGSVFDD